MRARLPCVVTVTGLGSLACGAGGSLAARETTPLPDMAPRTDPLPDTPLERGAPGRNLNPRDEKHGTIYVAAGDPARCYVHLPFDEPLHSWQPPKTQAVDCPESMHDAAWLECRNGVIWQSEDGADCACRVDGNPPPPDLRVHCPIASSEG